MKSSVNCELSAGHRAGCGDGNPHLLAVEQLALRRFGARAPAHVVGNGGQDGFELGFGKARLVAVIRRRWRGVVGLACVYSFSVALRTTSVRSFACSGYVAIVASRIHNSSSSSVVNPPLHRWGVISSRGEDFLPLGFFMR